MHICIYVLYFVSLGTATTQKPKTSKVLIVKTDISMQLHFSRK